MDPLAIVHASVRRTRVILISIGIAGLVLGGAMVLAGKFAADDGFGTTAAEVARFRIASVVVGGLLAALSIGLFIHGVRDWVPESAALTRLVDQRPADIRWIFVQNLSAKVGGITVKRARLVKVGDAAGKLHTIYTRSDDAMLALLEWMRTRAPQAQLGHDADAIAAFRAVKRGRRLTRSG